MDFIALLALAAFMGVVVGLGLYVALMGKQQTQQKPAPEPEQAEAPVRQVSCRTTHDYSTATPALNRY